MLITEYIKIKINRGNIGFYRKLLSGKINIGDDVDIPIEFAPKSLYTKVLVACDICNIEKLTTYRNYNDCLSYGFYSCNKCKHIKRKKTNLEKYGDENYQNIEKIKKTNLEKYGDEFYMRTDDYKYKKEKTNLEKWGVNNSSKAEEVKEKRRKTNLEKWGVNNPFESNEIKNKIKEKIKEKWDVSHISKNKHIKDKKQKTCLNNLGVEYPTQSKEVIKKIKETNLKKYGEEWYTMSSEYKYNHPSKNELYRNRYLISNNINYIKYLDDGISLFKCDLNKDHEFEISSSNYHHRKLFNNKLCTVCYPIGEFSSIKEKELYDYVKSIYKGKIIRSYRDYLEIDIYLPDLKIGFEFNGLYYHSDKFKDKNYHLRKTKLFKEKGIRIIHIWEDDWTYKRDILESQIRNWLGLTNSRIFARKCEILFVNKNDAKEFLDKNHIQGYNNNIKKTIGLYFNGELVSLMSFDNLEGRKIMSNGLNINRFCNKLNTNVIGGASKLLKFIIKNEIDLSFIISYADISISNGDLYKKLGFSISKISNPDYKYIINGVRRHKSNFKKSNLGIDKKITESKYMSDISLRIWDCGKIKYFLSLK